MAYTIERMFSPKDPGEIVKLGFDFGETADPLLSATVTMTRVGGKADANPSAMILGSANVVGTKAIQRVQSGIHGTDYEARCEAITVSEIIVMVGGLQVRTKRSV